MATPRDPTTLGVSAGVDAHQQLGQPVELLLAYLDYFRDSASRKVAGMTGDELRRSSLPSGWTPLELVKHLTSMERRWIEWGFAGVPLADPWADDDPATGRWRVPAGESDAEVFAGLRRVGEQTRSLLTGAELTTPARTGGRFPPDREPPTLGWILLHVLQEYARHVGHLDIVRELADGSTGD